MARAQSNGSFPEPSPPSPPARVAPPPSPFVPPAAPTPVAPAPVRAAPAAAPAYSPPVSPSLPAYQPAPSALALLPPVLPYRKGLPVPPGYRVVERSARGLTLGGGLTFLGSYVAALGWAAGQGFGNGSAYTAIPVAGPWAAIGGRSAVKCPAPLATATVSSVSLQKAINSCVGVGFDEVTSVVFLTADGLVQATGAVLFLIGLASGYEELVREDLPKAAVYRLPEGGMAFTVLGRF